MKRVAIDTNALLSFVTDRNPEQQAQAAELFAAAARLKLTILCPQNVVTEFIYVLERVYHVAGETIREMVADVVGMPGLEIVHELDYRLLLSLWPTRIGDFGDAIVAAACKSRRDVMLATFDRKFLTAAAAMGIKGYF